MVCAAKGYPLVVTMAETFSIERRKLMRFLGAKVVITPASARAVGMVKKTVELAEKHGWFYTRQFENEANADMHSRTTAKEILRRFQRRAAGLLGDGIRNRRHAEGRGAGAGQRSGPRQRSWCASRMTRPCFRAEFEQQRNQDGSAAAGHPAWKPHPMQGWSPDFIAKLAGDAVDSKVISQVLRMPNAEAMKCSKELARKEGIFVGISSGGDLCGRAARGGGGSEGIDDPVHVARHGRALSEHSALCGCFGRHDGGGSGDFPLHAGILDGTGKVGLEGILSGAKKGAGRKSRRRLSAGLDGLLDEVAELLQLHLFHLLLELLHLLLQLIHLPGIELESSGLKFLRNSSICRLNSPSASGRIGSPAISVLRLSRNSQLFWADCRSPWSQAAAESSELVAESLGLLAHRISLAGFKFPAELLERFPGQARPPSAGNRLRRTGPPAQHGGALSPPAG